MSTFVFEIKYLSDKFYEAYPHASCPEILEKDSRPYTCLLIHSHLGYYICIPFRTDINHRYAYHFKYSKRASSHRSGLDYTKTVLISNSSFFSNTSAVIDQDEFTELRRNISRIYRQITCYLDDYTTFLTGHGTISPEEFNRRYQFSTLPHFHHILHLQDTSSQTSDFIV